MRSPSVLLSEAWNIFTKNIKLFFGIYIIPAVIIVLVTFFFVEEEGESLEAIAALSPVILLLAAINIFMSLATAQAVITPSVGVKDAYGMALKKLLPYIWISIITAVAAFVGFILFIIPGIIVSVWFAFGLFVLLTEGKGGFAALMQSKEYVTGHWWAVFGRFLFLLLIALVVGFVVGLIGVAAGKTVEIILQYVLNFFLIPFSMAYMYLIYTDLKAQKASVSANTDSSGVNETQPDVQTPTPAAQEGEQTHNA